MAKSCCLLLLLAALMTTASNHHACGSVIDQDKSAKGSLGCHAMSAEQLHQTISSNENKILLVDNAELR